MKPLTALIVGAVLLAVLATVSIGLGTPVNVATRTAAIAGGVGIVVGALGTALLALLTRAALRTQLSVPVVVVVCVIALGALAGVNVVFSGRDLGALAMLLVAAGVVGYVLALMFAEDIRTASRSLQDAARGIGEGSDVSGPRPAIPELGELALELERTSVKLQLARERERAQDQARRELVSWVSHDLRAPLQRIRAAAEALEDRVFDDPERVGSLRRTLRVEADRLGALVDDLFELSRIEAGSLQLPFEPVSLEDLVSELLAAAAPTAQANAVTLDGHISTPVPQLQASPMHLARALSNLLDNAIRETPSGGTVTAEVGVDDGDAVVAINDECGGITDDQLSPLLIRPPRGQAGPPGHTGLGLPIAVGLVAAHGGTITVANRDGGCRFETRVPLLSDQRSERSGEHGTIARRTS